MKTTKKTHWFRNTLIVLIICGIIGVILASILFFKVERGKTTIAASVQFSFDGAAEGYGPNGVPLTMDAISSDDVLTEALAVAGLEGSCTAEQVRANLTVSGVYPDDLVEQMTSYDSLLDFTGNRTLNLSNFHPTLFRVTLENGFTPALSAEKLTELMHNIMECFRKDFTSRYSYAMNYLQGLGVEFDGYDYSQLLEILQQSMTQQARYAQEMHNKEPFFMVGGKGFNDIYVQLNSLIEGEVARLNSNITINALTRDTARLLTQYQFEIRDLNNQLSRQQERLKRLDELIASYDKNEIIYLSTADSLTKIDGNSSETYDALVGDRKDVSDEITQINSRITTYQLKLADLMKGAENAIALTQSNAAPAAETAAIAVAEEAEETETDAAVVEAAETAAEVTIDELTEEEIAEAAAAAEELTARQKTVLESSFENLIAKQTKIAEEFDALLKAYNEQELNEITVNIFNYKYDTPKVFSGAFIKQVIKCAGPLCAVGFMVCMVGLIRSRKSEAKASQGSGDRA